MMRFQLVLVVALITTAHATRAEPPPALTLAQAQAEAREHAPERAAADATVAGADARAAVAGRRFTHDPIAIGHYQQPAPGDRDTDRAWSVGLEWTVDLSGAWRPRGAAGRASVSAAQLDRAGALVDLDVEVAIAFAEVADAQRRVARSSQMVALREVAAHAAERLRTTGSGNQLDLDASTLDLKATQVEAANSRGDLDAARVRLSRLLGRNDATPVVADDLDLAAAPPLAAIDELVARDPRVKAAAAELDAARLIAEAEHKAARPGVTFGIEAGRTSHDIPAGAFASMPSLTGAWNEWEIAVSLSVPLPVFDRNRVARASSDADVLAAQARLATAQADARRNIGEARARLAAAIDAVNAATDVPAIIDRELQLLDKALRAGGIELGAFALQAHRLVEVGRVYDDAVLSLRRARAAWARYAQP